MQEVNLSNPELHKKREDILPFLKVPSCSTVERNIEWWVSFDVFLNAIQRKPRTVLVLREVWLLTGDCSKVNMIQVGVSMTLSNVMKSALTMMYFKSQLGCWCLGSDFKSLQHHYLQVWLWCLDSSESRVTSSRCLLYLWAFQNTGNFGAMGQGHYINLAPSSSQGRLLELSSVSSSAAGFRFHCGFKHWI